MDTDGGDAIGRVLGALEIHTQLYFRAELGRPFAVEVPEEEPGVIRFHAVADGSCSIAVGRGGTSQTLALAGGDLVLVPRGAPHRIADGVASDVPSRPLDTLLRETGFRGEGPLVAGGAGRRAVLVCGHFAFRNRDPAAASAREPLHPLLASLPPLVHVPASGGFAWLEPILGHLESEARAQRSGYREVARRLSEILLIEVLRAHAESGESAALAAVADPQLGRALRAIHERPEADWTLAGLARVAGQSRSGFAERFRTQLGTSPMRYLADWRLQQARRLIEHEGLGVAEAARRVGYASDSAFHRGFRVRFGVAPGALRRDRG